MTTTEPEIVSGDRVQVRKNVIEKYGLVRQRPATVAQVHPERCPCGGQAIIMFDDGDTMLADTGDLEVIS